MINRFINNKTIILLMLIVLLLILGYFVLGSRQNPYGDSVSIININQYTQGKKTNRDTLQFIQHSLYKTITLNTPDATANQLNDIAIREGTFSQNYNKDTKLNSVNFIVDIPSLRQSYDISYQWVDSGGNKRSIDEYGTVVKCLNKDRVIYKDFQCKDMFSETKKYADPIIEFLPHSTRNYKVTYNATRKSLEVEISLSAADIRSKREHEIIEKYKAEIRDWISSKKLNPDAYSNIYLSIKRASLY